MSAMIACAQQTHFTPNIGVAAAQVTPLGAYPLLDYLIATSETVSAGVRQLARYFRLIGNPVRIEIDDTCEPVRVDLGTNSEPSAIEYSAALLILHLRDETEGRFRAERVSFQHVPDDAATMEGALGCIVHTASRWNGVTVPRESWILPLRRRDSALRQVLEAHAENILARLPARSGVSADVQRVLASRIGERNTSIDACARHLAMSGRTLQRRLAAEGVTYLQLLEEARKEAARRFLGEDVLAISEVAYLVGYAEPSPFSRAFKCWYGMTPETFRRTQRERRV